LTLSALLTKRQEQEREAREREREERVRATEERASHHHYHSRRVALLEALLALLEAFDMKIGTGEKGR
jgi:hypothetical protein